MRSRGWKSVVLLIVIAVMAFAGVTMCEEVTTKPEVVVEAFWVKYIPVIAEALIGLVVTLWGMAKAKYYLIDGPRETKLQAAKVDVIEAIENVAEELYIEKVRDMKTAAADGKLTKNEIGVLQNDTWERVLSQLKSPAKDLIVAMGRAGLNKLLARVIGNAKVGG